MHQEHVLRLESRPPNIEGKGQVTIRDLVRNSLRMRPDRIIVGEVRGAEALDMLQAMNTGHEGSLSTVHANSPRDAPRQTRDDGAHERLRLARPGHPRADVFGARRARASLLVCRTAPGASSQIAEIEDMEGDTVVMQDIFRFDYSMGMDESGRFLGQLKSTGIRPKFAEKLEYLGIEMPADSFAPELAQGR